MFQHRLFLVSTNSMVSSKATCFAEAVSTVPHSRSQTQCLSSLKTFFHPVLYELMSLSDIFSQCGYLGITFCIKNLWIFLIQSRHYGLELKRAKRIIHKSYSLHVLQILFILSLWTHTWYLTSATCLFITAIHTIINSIAQPSDWYTVCFIFALKLIFLTFYHTVHLLKHIRNTSHEFS